MREKVLVAMSGGVDSSVAISKILDQGYEAIGITLKLWETKDPETNKNKASNCNSIEAINGAKMVCDRLGVHHYTLDYIETFRKYFHLSGIKSETKKLIEFYIIKAQKNLSFIPEKKRGNLISYTELILNRKF